MFNDDDKKPDYACPNCEEDKPAYREPCPDCGYDDKKVDNSKNK